MLAVKKTDSSAEVTVIDNKDFDLLHSCGLPYCLNDEIENIDDLKHDLGLEGMGIKKIKASAVKIDSRAKLVVIDSGEKISYDKLIIASGSHAFVPPIEGA